MKRRQFLVPIILALVLIGLVAGVIIPLTRRIFKQRQKLADRQQARIQLENKVAALSSIDAAAQDAVLKISMEALPVSVPFQQSLSLIEQLSQRHQVGVRELTVSVTGRAVNLSFVTAGAIDSLQNFLADVNKVLPITRINSLELTQMVRAGIPVSEDEPVASAQIYSSQLNLSVNWQELPTTIGKPSDPLPILTDIHQQTKDQLRSFESIAVVTGEAGPPISSERAGRLFPE